MEFTAGQLAAMLKGQVEGDENVKVSTFAKIEEGRTGAISFLSNPKYTEYLYSTKSSVVLVSNDFVPTKEYSCTLLRVVDPYAAVAQLLRLADQYLSPKRNGIHPSAFISDKAKVGENVYIGQNVVIEDGAVIGNGCQIYANTFIGQGVTLEEDSLVYANVTIYKGCKIGKRCVLQAGCVIGGDGFGFAPNPDGSYSKIPQLGIVRLEDDVEIGANSTVDRATMGETVIHKGVKIDNLVHIAHNVVVGDNTVMAALTGIAGSTKIGKHCMFGGQSGVVGHVEVADNSNFAAKCGVSSSIKTPGQQWHFYPHMEGAKFRRSYVCLKQLPETVKVVSETEKQLRVANERIEMLEKQIQELASKIK